MSWQIRYVYNKSKFICRIPKRNTKHTLPGHGERDMYQRIMAWGYYATQEACRTWLALYRLVSGGIDGNASVYTLSRQDLQKWYYVEKLTPTQYSAGILRSMVYTLTESTWRRG